MIKPYQQLYNTSGSYILVAVLFTCFVACSDDENEDPPMSPEPVNLTIVEGKYRGTWDWEFGAGPISMELRSTGNDLYDVNFYETANFTPGFNTDGVTPDAIGVIEIIDTQATIDMQLRTDNPPCTGDYTGTGTRNDQGVLHLEMSIVHTCATDAPAIFTLTKSAN